MVYKLILIASILILSILAIVLIVCCLIKFKQRNKNLTNERNEIVANYNILVKEQTFNRKLIKQQEYQLQQVSKVKTSQHSLKKFEAVQSLNKFALDVYLNLLKDKNGTHFKY